MSPCAAAKGGVAEPDSVCSETQNEIYARWQTKVADLQAVLTEATTKLTIFREKANSYDEKFSEYTDSTLHVFNIILINKY